MEIKIYRILPLVLSFCLLFSCSKMQTPNSDQTPESVGQFESSGEINMAFVQNDTLSPYEAKTKSNQEISRLMYDGLIRLDENFEPVYVLASDIAVDGKSVTVTINSYARFTDGKNVSAEDVVYSISAAKNAAESKYCAKLENVTGYSAKDSSTLELTLKNTDEYVARLLDFPVFEKETEKQVNADNKSVPPVGSGRYIFIQENDKYYLKSNSDWIGGRVNIAKINLINLPDDDAIKHGTSVGSVDVYYSDLSQNDIPTMKGTTLPVVLHNLVYLGVNTSSGILSDENLRRCVSAAIDREEITNSVYFGYATAAKGLFHSNLSELSGLQTINTSRDTESASAYLKNAGYVKEQAGDLALNSRQKGINLTLVYNSENNARLLLATKISEYLKSAGIQVTLKGLPFDEYTAAIQYHSYDLYIGEIKIPDNLDAYSLATAGGLLTISFSSDAQDESQIGSETSGNQQTPSDSSDVDADTVQGETGQKRVSLEEALYKMHNGNGSVAEVLSCLNEQMSIIPICHRKGLVIYSDKISDGLSPVPDDPFNGIENCTALSN